MTRNHKAVSIIMALALCLSLLAPVVVLPQAAQAIGVGSALTVPTVTTGSTKSLGSVIIQDDSGAICSVPNVAGGTRIEVLLPSGVEYSVAPAALANYVSIPAAVNGKSNILTAGSLRFDAASTTKMLVFEIYANAITAASTTVAFQVNFNAAGSRCNITQTGDVMIGFLTNNASIPAGTQVLNAHVASAGTVNLALDKLNVGEGSTAVLGSIQILENSAGAVASGATFDVILPDGVTWNSVPTFTTGLGFTAPVNATLGTTSAGLSKLSLKIQSQQTVPGFLVIQSPSVTIASTVPNGDIVAQLRGTGALANITDGDVTIGVKGDYTVAVTAGDAPTIYAGSWDIKDASIFLKESIKGSLVATRTVTVELPSNAMWTTLPMVSVKSGDILCGALTVVPKTNYRKVTFTITTASNSASEIELKNGKIAVEADSAAGDVTATVAGTATAAGSVVVAKVASPVTMTVDPVKNIIIGAQNQAAGDVTITEAAAGLIKSTESTSGTNATCSLVLQLPAGVTWAVTPKVEVTAGNLKLDVLNLRKSGSYLYIPVLTSSTGSPATLKVSGIQLTSDRTVPEGGVELDATGNSLDRVTNQIRVTTAAYYDANRTATYRTAAFTNVANTITPAPTETIAEYNGEFTVGSTIYYANGIAKVMDVAPFLQNDRNYVPYRYLAISLGIPDDADHIAWDQATQTVTLTTVSGKVIKATVNSNILTVDGTETKMDVKTQLVNNRVFLPARFLAEAMGGTVGWDQTTQTCLVSVGASVPAAQ